MHQIDCNDLGEMHKLLTGYYPVRKRNISWMDHEPDILPTSVSVVISDYIYKDIAYKQVFQKALLKLLSGSADDVYLCFAYFNECLLNEELNCAGYKIDKEVFIEPLRKAIKINAKKLSETPAWKGGISRLDRIIDRSENYRTQYGFSLI